VPHGLDILKGVPVKFDELKRYFFEHDNIEGIVWHHPDGRMAKIKGKDFGIKRRVAVDDAEQDAVAEASESD
jgi:hypothetical protein